MDTHKHAQTIIPESPTARLGAHLKTDYLCPACGSCNVAHDAAVRWDFATQAFTISGVHDYVCCQDCGRDSDTGHEFFASVAAA